ncbi:MAG TPA: hypothetical protein VE130_03810 [Nitrososphaeraceae archaeon]|nr:hypothetical protein [Nitrososphaeraceae archaeon]
MLRGLVILVLTGNDDRKESTFGNDLDPSPAGEDDDGADMIQFFIFSYYSCYKVFNVRTGSNGFVFCLLLDAIFVVRLRHLEDNIFLNVFCNCKKLAIMCYFIVVRTNA